MTVNGNPMKEDNSTIMQKINRKAIFIDIDGTLSENGALPSDYTIKILHEAQKQGHLIFLNTGRSVAFIPKELREADYVDGIVAGGGAHVLFHGKTIHHKVIPEDQLCAISELYLRLGKWCQFEGEVDNYRIIDNGQMKVVNSPDDFRTIYKGALITKITMEGVVSEEERELLHKWFYIYKLNGYSEGITRGESKTGGIKCLLEASGIPWEDTVAIGDSENDIEMIMNVAFGIAMKNAVPELKQIAKAVTDDCAHDGVGKAIEQYILIGALS